MLLGALFALPGLGRDFTFTYEGQTLTYTVLDEEAKTCETKQGVLNYEECVIYPGNNVEGQLTIPSVAVDGTTQYTVTKIGRHSFIHCNLTSVFIPNSVKEIGFAAFTDCVELTSVDIPNSVTSLGASSFSGCSGLESVDIPNSVTSLGGCAFSDCNGLESVVIPNSITTLEYGVFQNCSGLKSVVLPNSIESFESQAFTGCTGLTSIYYDTWNPVRSDEWYIFSQETYQNATLYVPECALQLCTLRAPWNYFKKIEKIEGTFIDEFTYTYEGNTLTYIVVDKEAKTCKTKDGGFGFGGNTVSGHLTIPSYASDGTNNYIVIALGDLAFNGSKGLISATVPNSISSLSYGSFQACSGLTSVTLPNSLKTIEDAAFLACESLSSIDIPNSVTKIGICSFMYCSALTSLVIPNSVTNINQQAFYNCSGLTTVVLPSSIKELGRIAFDGCTSLTSVYYDALDPIDTRDSEIFTNYTYENATLYILEEGIDWCAYREPWKNFKKIEKIDTSDIPDEFTYTYDGITLTYTVLDKLARTVEVRGADPGDFWGDMVIPSVAAYNGKDFSVVALSEYAFYGYRGMASVVIPNTVTAIGDMAFQSCEGLTEIQIPNSVTSIGRAAFAGCSELTNIVIPANVSSIGDEAFNDCRKLTAINVEANNTAYASENGALFTKDYSEIIRCPEGKSGEFNIPAPVKIIGAGAFFYCQRLTNITIPESVTTISNNAFAACYQLSSIKIPASVASIGLRAFNSCSSLTSIKVDAANAFYADYDGVLCNKDMTLLITCPSGKQGSFDIPSTIETIGESAFEMCYYITSVSIPASVNTIDRQAFRMCGITAIDLPNSITTIGDMAFHWCSGLETLVLPNSVTTIGRSAFMECLELKSVTIPASVTTMGEVAFYRCSALTDVYYLAETPIAADPELFGGYGATNTYQKATLYVPEAAVEKCKLIDPWKKFEKIEILDPSFCPNNFIYTHEGQTLSYTVLDRESMTVTLKPGKDYIPGNYVTGSLEIPEQVQYGNMSFTVVSIGDAAFTYCDQLTSVVLPNSIVSIGENAFNNCPNLTFISLPSSLKTIGRYAFGSCESLASVILPEGVSNIGYHAFDHCISMTDVHIPSSVTTIGEGAFMGCEALTRAEFENIESLCSIDFADGDSNPIAYARRLFIDGNEVTELHIPSSISSIAQNAFFRCEGLTSVTIPNSVTEMGVNAFYGCKGLKKAEFASIEALCSFDFATIHTNPVYYAEALYIDGNKISELEIPSSVSHIGNRTFAGASGLTSVNIPCTVTSIGVQAFYMSSIAAAYIPASIESIGERAFSYSDLAAVYYNTQEPLNANANCFSTANYNDATLYVPEAAVEKCKLIDPWKNFAKIEAYDFSGIQDMESDVDSSVPCEVYNLNGVKVGTSTDGLPAGMYIVRCGGKIYKVAIQ